MTEVLVFYPIGHIDHVSVSPSNGIGPTQGQRNTLTRVGIIEPMTFRLDHRCYNRHIIKEGNFNHLPSQMVLEKLLLS